MSYPIDRITAAVSTVGLLMSEKNKQIAYLKNHSQDCNQTNASSTQIYIRSASRGDYLIPCKQNIYFSAAGPSIWNGIPFELRSLLRDFSSSFYSLLKTFLFARA